MSLPEVSRRAFLSLSARAGGAAAALLATPLGCSVEPRPGLDTAGLRVLSPDELVVADAAADALLPGPRAGGPGVGARALDLARRLDAFLEPEHPEVVRGLKSGLWLLDRAAPLQAGRLGRFHGLDAEGRSQVLAALARGPDPGRTLYVGLRQACLFLFYAADESWPATGYDGPWVGRGGEGAPA